MTRRLMLPVGTVAALCARLQLRPPPGFDGGPADGVEVHVQPSLAAGLRATCAPRVAVVVRSALGQLEAVAGIRGDLGGSLLRAGSSDVEVSAWLPASLDRELARMVPRLPDRAGTRLHLPLSRLAQHPDLADALGTLHATVLAPPYVVGQVVWLATRAGWLSVEPAAIVGGQRHVTVTPVRSRGLGAAVAPLVASALA